MKQAFLKIIIACVPDRRRWICLMAAIWVVVLLPVLAAMLAYSAIQPNSNYVLTERSGQRVKVGVVLGAGVDKDNKPFKELQARLDLAARELAAGRVDKLILSGDNRFHHYNEPDAMKDYLVNEKHIPADKLQADYAGRSTYESCERAAKVFGLKQTIIFSAESHLPRAIFLCRYFGITSYGMGTNVEANNHVRHEALARVKALLNIYVRGEPTVLGDRITVQ